MNPKLMLTIMVLIVIPLFPFTLANTIEESVNFEAEQNWNTYKIGGTCVYGTHNIFVSDLDGDGVKEIITGGFSYNTVDGLRTTSEAPLKIWTWNGQNVTLKANSTWYGSIVCLYAADVDQDGKVDLFTGGSFRNEAGNLTTALRAYNFNGHEISLESSYEGIPISSIFVSDVNSDGALEILSIGRYRNEPYLSIWRLQRGNLTVLNQFSLAAANITSASSVYASDLDNDGQVEIAISGYSDKLSDSKGLVSIWQLVANQLELKARVVWQLGIGTAKTIAGGVQGNTVVNNIKAGDLNGDGCKEVVTGGYTFNGTVVFAEIKVFGWDGSKITELASQRWATDYLTEAKCIALNDVNGDGELDIVQSGITAAANSFKNPDSVHDRAQLRVWGYNETGIFSIASKDWTFDDGACAWNVANGDVDNDGVVEIVTVGCTAFGDLCDPDMRIWSLPIQSNTATAAVSDDLIYTFIVVIVVAVSFAGGFLYFKKSSWRKKTP